ncbi:MAG: serine/threonine-protein kinase, partial [Acidobacteriota bacterium]
MAALYKARDRRDGSPAVVEVFSAGTTRDEAASLRPGFEVQDAADGRLFVVRPIPRGEVDATILEIPRRSSAGPLQDDPDASIESLEPVEPETESIVAPPRPAIGRIGSRAAHYRILEQVGRGGMGVVYRAEDTRLRRTVALKFLPSGLTRNQVAKSLFLKEARAASALDHDNLCTIHEVGEAGEGGETELYLAMAFYDGETVRAKIDRGPLPVAAAVDIARQAAQGLAKAHRLGIVHRDIKPANLMVTSDGVVKILDFGIAKLAGAADPGRDRLPPGTPAYMSPEQAGGDEVDARADVWSLGIVLHEMLTGARPIDGRIRSDIPAELQRVLGRMLAPSLADRHPTAVEALADL